MKTKWYQCPLMVATSLKLRIRLVKLWTFYVTIRAVSCLTAHQHRPRLPSGWMCIVYLISSFCSFSIQPSMPFYAPRSCNVHCVIIQSTFDPVGGKLAPLLMRHNPSLYWSQLLYICLKIVKRLAWKYFKYIRICIDIYFPALIWVKPQLTSIPG